VKCGFSIFGSGPHICAPLWSPSASRSPSVDRGGPSVVATTLNPVAVSQPPKTEKPPLPPRPTLSSRCSCGVSSLDMRQHARECALVNTPKRERNRILQRTATLRLGKGPAPTNQSRGTPPRSGSVGGSPHRSPVSGRRTQENISSRPGRSPNHGVRNRGDRRPVSPRGPSSRGGGGPGGSRGRRQYSVRRDRRDRRTPSARAPGRGGPGGGNAGDGPRARLDPIRGDWPFQEMTFHMTETSYLSDLSWLPWKSYEAQPPLGDAIGMHFTWISGVDSESTPCWYLAVDARLLDRVHTRNVPHVTSDRLHPKQFRGLQRPICLELVSYLAQYAMFRPRTYETLSMIRNRGIAWCKEFKLSSQGRTVILSSSISLAFRILEEEREALRMLRSADVSQDIETSRQLSSGEAFETERQSWFGDTTGRIPVLPALNRMLARFSRPRVVIAPSSKK